MATGISRSRRRKFICAGYPGACIFSHHPILGFTVHGCLRCLVYRNYFVSKSSICLRFDNKTLLERMM